MAAIKQTMENILNKVFPEPNTGCWLWAGATCDKGYGAVQGFHGKVVKAHRLFYSFYKGEIKHGLHVCHTCDTPQCVNPDHLWLGTNTDNHRDKTKKGRNHQTKKTHCPLGHEYSKENTRTKISKNGHIRRVCYLCHRERDKIAKRIIRAKRTSR